MKKRSFPLFPLLILAVLIAILLLCTALIRGISPYLTEFQDVQADTPLLYTYYHIDYTNQDLILKNTLTQVTTPILLRYSPVALPPAYQLLRVDDHIFLLIRLAPGGNNSAYWFKVFDLSLSPVADVMARYDDPNMGHSCTNPVLNYRSLEFVIAPNCSADPQDASAGFENHWIDLVS